MKKIIGSFTILLSVFLFASCEKEFAPNFPPPTVVMDSNLLVTKNLAYLDQTPTPNSLGVKIGSYFIKNLSNTDTVQLVSVKVGLNGTSPLGNQKNLRTSELTGTGGVPITNPDSVNSFNFDFKILPGSIKVLDLFEDLGPELNVTIGTNIVLTYKNLRTSAMGTSKIIAGQSNSLIQAVVNLPTLVYSSSDSSQYIPTGIVGNIDAIKTVHNVTATGPGCVISELLYRGGGLVGVNFLTSVKVNGVSGQFIGYDATISGLNIVVPVTGIDIESLTSYDQFTGPLLSYSSNALSLVGFKYSVSGGPQITSNFFTGEYIKMICTGSVPHPSVDINPHTGLVFGAEVLIGEVLVTANFRGDIAQKQIKWNFTGSGFVSGYNLSAVRTADITSTTISGSITTTDGVNFVKSEFNPQYLVPANTSKIFRIYGIVSGVSVSGNAQLRSVLGMGDDGYIWTDISGSLTLIYGGHGIRGFPKNPYILRQ